MNEQPGNSGQLQPDAGSGGDARFYAHPSGDGAICRAGSTTRLCLDELLIELNSVAARQPVGQEFSEVAQRKLSELQVQGYQINGYALMRQGEHQKRVLIDYLGHVRWSDTAPPAPTAVPVGVEPVAARFDFDGYGYRYIDDGSGSCWARYISRREGAEFLYTAPPAAVPVDVIYYVVDTGQHCAEHVIPVSAFGEPAIFAEKEKAEEFCKFANGTGRSHEVRVFSLVNHPQPASPYNSSGIDLTACQLLEALMMAGDPEFDTDFDDRGRVRIFYNEAGHSGPGVYCECVGAEEEGCILLDGTSPSIRTAPAAVPVEDDVLRMINSKDLYQVLMDVQNGIDSPALSSMANGAIRLIDRARTALVTHPQPAAAKEQGNG